MTTYYDEQGDNLLGLMNGDKWREDWTGQVGVIVGQFFNPVGTLLGSGRNIGLAVTAAQDLPDLIREADASAQRAAEMQEKYEKEIKPREQALMERQVQQQAAADREKLLKTLEGLRVRKAQEEEMLANAQQERAKRWFITGDLDSKIENMQRSLEERQQAIERIERALKEKGG